MPQHALRPARAALGTVLSRPRLRRSILAYLLFNIADLATWVALLVFAYDRGGAPAAAIIAAVQLVPPALLTPVGALIGDRLHRDRALAIGYLCQSATLAAVGTALWADASMQLIYLIAAIDAVAASISRPIYLASLPGHVEHPGELAAANSVSMMIEEAGTFAGPAVAALILSVSDPWVVYAVFVGSQLAAALLVVGRAPRATGVGPPDADAATDAEGGGGLRLKDVFAGLGELRRSGRAMLLLGYIGVSWLVAGGVELLAVVLALDVLGGGDAAPGILLAAAGVGGLIGAAWSVVLIGRRRLAPAIAGAMMLGGLPLTVAGLSPGLAVACGLFMLAAAGGSLLDVAARTLLQQTMPARVLARVFGLHESLVLSAQAVGVLLVPVLIAAVGPSATFAIAGLLLPVLCVATWGALRRLDRETAPDPALALLRDNPIFGVLAPPELEGLARCLRRIDVEPGEVVVRQGRLGERFFLIQTGRFDVAVDGLPRPSRGPGECFGEIALLRNVPRTATVTAATPGRLLGLSRGDFLAALTRSAAARASAGDLAAQRLAGDRPAGRRRGP